MNEPTTVGPSDDRREIETSLREEVESLGRIVDQQERTIAVLSREVDLHSAAIGWRLQQRLTPLRQVDAAVPVVRQIYRALYRVLEIWVDEGFLKIFSRAGHKVGLALRGQNFLVEGADRRAPRIEDHTSSGWFVRARPERRHADGDRAFRNRPLIACCSVWTARGRAVQRCSRRSEPSRTITGSCA